MSKRFPKFISKQDEEIKKPKLELTKNEPNKQSTKAPDARVTDLKNAWDDDDWDEYIILASQAVEDNMFSQNNMNSSNLTYGKFSNAVQSSTQQFKKPSTNMPNEKDDLFTEDIGTSDDSANLKANGSVNLSVLFNVTSVTRTLPETATTSSSTKKTSPRESEMLLASLEAIRRDNNKLKNDLNEINEKMQTKDGEVAILRNELKRVKQQNENLRLEKLQENDNLKKDSMEKIKELEKELNSSKTQLEFKKFEISSIKNKKLNESQKILEMDMPDFSREINELETKYFEEMPFEIKSNTLFEINPEIFDDLDEGPTLSSFISPKDNESLKNLKNIQILLSQLQSLNDLNFITNKKEKILGVSKSYVNNLHKYANQLKFSQFSDKDSNSSIEYDLLCRSLKKEKEKNENSNIYQLSKMSIHEKGTISRRLTAALSIICKYSSEICYAISDQIINNENDISDNNDTCLTVLIDALGTISVSNNVDDHFALVNAAAQLLYSLSFHFKNDTNKYKILIEFFKTIVFSRPDANTLNILSKVLCKMCDLNKEFSHQLCQPNEEHNFTLNDINKTLRFSRNSCVFHVYAALLETAVPQYETLTDKQYKLLTTITINTGIFLRKCIVHLCPWITVINDHNESKKSLCFIRLSSSYVVLFHLCLKNWINNPKSILLSTISSIARFGAILLNDIFHIYYRPIVLQIGGFLIKQRLPIIYDWLNQYHKLFNFDIAHIKALTSVDFNQIIVDPLKTEDDSNNTDSQESEELNNYIFDNFFELKI